MESFCSEVRGGWREARWSGSFTLVALPGTLFVFLLTAAIEGQVSDPPSSLTWGLEALVLLVALAWAGLQDGPAGFLGRTVWNITGALVVLYAIARFLQSGASEQRVVFRGGADAARPGTGASPQLPN
jgi:hypothetical protein